MSGDATPGLPVSGMTQVEYTPGLLVPAVDMTAPVGEKNVAVQLSEIVAAAQAGATEEGFQPTTSALDVAAAGTTQATATPLTAQDSIVTTCPPGTGVIATAEQIGAWCTVFNATTEGLLLWPLQGAQWGAQEADTAAEVPPGALMRFKLYSVSQGYAG